MDTVYIGTYLPFWLAVGISFLDFVFGYYDKYFDSALDTARANFRRYGGQDISPWPFHCFREALVRKGQTAFLGLLIVQCIVSIAVGVADIPDHGNVSVGELETMLSTVIALGILLFALMVVLFVSFFQPYAYAWYYPRTLERFSHTLRAAAGRVVLIFIFWAMLVYTPDVIGILQHLRSVHIDVASLTMFGFLTITLLPAILRAHSLRKGINNAATCSENLHNTLSAAIYDCDVAVTPLAVMAVHATKELEPSLRRQLTNLFELPGQHCVYSTEKHSALIIVLPGLGAAEAGMKAETLINDHVAEHNGNQLISIGISIYKFHGHSPDSLVERAIKACGVAAKRQSKIAIAMRSDTTPREALC